MNDNTTKLQKWAETWDKAHFALNSVKSIEMSEDSYVSDSLSSLSEVFNYALATAKPSTSSGLVEMQKFFAKLRKK